MFINNLYLFFLKFFLIFLRFILNMCMTTSHIYRYAESPEEWMGSPRIKITDRWTEKQIRVLCKISNWFWAISSAPYCFKDSFSIYFCVWCVFKYISVHTCMRCLQRPEEGIDLLELTVQEKALDMGAGNWSVVIYKINSHSLILLIHN